MRILIAFYKKVQIILRGVLYGFRKVLGGGSLSTILRKILFIYRQEGVFGFKNRLARGDKKNLTIGPNSHYHHWINKYDSVNTNIRNKVVQKILKFNSNPTISILMVASDPKIELFVSALRSVLNQLYRNIQLIVVDNSANNPNVGKILNLQELQSHRVAVIKLANVKSKSDALNCGLKRVQGQYMMVIGHQDELSETALFWVVEAIQNCPRASLIYSDEDKICEFGVRSQPYFKPDWDINLYLGQNFVGQTGVYKTEVVLGAGGFYSDYDGAETFELGLRCIETLSEQKIVHIPRILYHSRLESSMTAFDRYLVTESSSKAIRGYLNRVNLSATVLTTSFGFRVKYALPEVLPLVSLIVPTRNNLEVLKPCIESIIEKTTYGNFEILIVDNGSDNLDCLQYLELVSDHPNIRVARDPSPFNYASINNRAVKLAKGSIIGLINNDTEIIAPEWMAEMVSHILRPSIGVVGAALMYPDDSYQHAGITLGIGGVAGHSFKGLKVNDPDYFSHTRLVKAYSAVTAACLFVRKSVYLEVGGLNEKRLAIAYNDVDFCLKVGKLGYQNLWTPYAKLYHYESKSRGAEDNRQKRRRFNREFKYMRQTWGVELDNDGNYNPNLSLCYEDYSLAFPPRIELII